jgi:CHAT domain-containing protein
VRTVVASWWDVEDAAARRFMELFYGRLKEGVDRDRALSGARAEMAREGYPARDRLAFALIGATATPVTALSDPGSGIPRFPYWILILSAAISAGLGWRRWNSRSSTSEQP